MCTNAYEDAVLTRQMDDDAVADEGFAFVVDNSRRQQVEVKGDSVHDDGVTRVVAALTTTNQVGIHGQQVHQFP